MNITLEARRRSANASYLPGEIIRGDRTIIVDGTPWGHVEMKGHGMHGNSFLFHDANGEAIYKRDKDGKPRHSPHYIESAWGENRRDKRSGDTRTTDQRIIEKAAELITSGQLRSPADLAAEAAKELQENQAWVEKRDADKAMMREALRRAWERPDLSNADREGLALAWSEIFHGSIDEVTP